MKNVLLVLLCVSATLAAEKAPVVPDFAKDWIGVWQLDGKNEYMRLEPDKFTQYSPSGGLTFMRAKLTPGKMILKQNGGQMETSVSIKNGKLLLVADNVTHEYVKMKAAPPELELKPIVFGKNSVPAASLKEIQTELGKRVVEDQAVRKDAARRNEMGKIDGDNTAYLKKVVQQYGWIDATRFGAEASHAAFLLVQHSGDLPLMVAALPEIEKDTKSGKLSDGQSYALLYDRTMLYLGGKQRYGTQVSGGPAGVVVLLLEDKENVERRRKEIGVFPLAQYLAVFKQRFGAKDVKYEED